MEWNEMDVCDLLTQNNYFKHAIITVTKGKRVSESESSSKKKYLSLQIMTLGC